MTRRVSPPIVALVVVAVAVGAWAGLRPGTTSQKQTSITQEVAHFRDISDMAASSDLVIDGTVVEVTKGRSVGPPGEELQFTRVTIRVDRVFSGVPPAGVVELEEDGFLYEPLSAVGDRGVFFLHLKKDSPSAQPFFVLASSQGRFLDLDGKVVASNDEMDWVAALEGVPFPAFETLVAEAVAPLGGQGTPSPSA